MPVDEAGAPPVENPELRALDPGVAGSAATAAPGDAGLGIAPPDGRISREDAARLARLGLDWVLDAACRQYPVLSYDEATREHGAQLAGAVLAKYDVMKWTARWREEFALGLFVAGLAWRSYQLVQQSKAAPPVTAQEPPAAGASPPAPS